MGRAEVLALALVLAVVCHGAHAASLTTAQGHKSIRACIYTRADMKVLKKACDTGALIGCASLADPNLVVTGFLPLDSAWNVFLKAYDLTLDELLSDPVAFSAIASYHLIPGAAYKRADVPKGSSEWPTVLPNNNITLQKGNGVMYVRAALSRGKVIKFDIPAGKSIVHTLDRVLVPFKPVIKPAASPLPSGGGGTGAKPQFATIGAALAATPTLRTLLAGVNAVGLTDDLADPNFKATVFAPVDDAFQNALAVLGATQAELLASIDLVGLIVGDHIHIGDALMSSSLKDKQLVPVSAPNTYNTPEGSNLLVTINATGVFVGAVTTAKVIKADVTAGAAVIHIVDSVIITQKTLAYWQAKRASPAPKPAEPTGEPAAAMQFDTIGKALQGRPELSGLYVAVTGSFASIRPLLDNAMMTMTLFAPTNEGITAVVEGYGLELQDLFTAEGLFAAVAANHFIYTQALASSALKDGMELPIDGASEPITVDITSEGVFIKAKNTVKVIQADIKAGASYIHEIDGFIITDAVDQMFKAISCAKYKTNCDEPATPTTPTPSSTTPVAPAVPSPAPVDDTPLAPTLFDFLGNVEVAGGTVSLGILKTVITLAGKMDIAADPNLVATVFAPTDTAFMAMLGSLGVPPDQLFTNAALIDRFLGYHLHIGKIIRSTEITNGQKLPMGLDPTTYATTTDTLTFTVSGTDITIDAAKSKGKIIDANYRAGKLIIHVVDAVLVPLIPGLNDS